MPKIYSEKSFRISDHLTAFCRCEDTRYGFRHVASLHRNGYVCGQAKVCYYNRTWEAYEFQSVLRELAERKANEISPEERETIRTYARDYKDQASNDAFRTIGLVAALGSIFMDNQAEANDWKKRMIAAGLGDHGLDIPEDWDQLPEDEKSRRLDAVIAELGGAA